MTRRVEVDGVGVLIQTENLGRGYQGTVHKGVLESDTGLPVLVKELRASPIVEGRTRFLCRQNLSSISPGFAAPVVCEQQADGGMIYLAPFVEGVSQEEAPPGALPQNLETCLEFVGQIQLLEEHGIAHGDIAFDNLLMGPDGSVNLIDFDGFLADDDTVPDPDIIGHRPMLAPEQRDGAQPVPTRASGYFAMAVFMSMVLTGRYPTDGLPDEPAAVDRLMSQGHWPEHDRSPEPDEEPIAALGQELQDLFDLAFSLNPKMRPGPDVWRRALTRALNNLWVHDCGQAFVGDDQIKACPGCHQAVSISRVDNELKIQIVGAGPRYGVKLVDGQVIILGRSTMPHLSGHVSGRHLEILPCQGQLLLRHVGLNPTLLRKNGQWYRLEEFWLAAESLKNPLRLKLADVEIDLEIP
ncbi:MAG: hypothetical protein COC12_04390 [Rhodobacteraceae bacterium]|nr:MAG: hypothetical protein COC12_04390 [Paracoccaceae bacterium]